MNEFKFTPDQEVAVKECIDFVKAPIINDETNFKTLIGSAGSGKTTVIKYVLGDCGIPQRSIGVTAPTHQAKKIIAKSTALPATTIQSLLGLRPDLSLDSFDITRPVFNPLADEQIGGYRLIIIDEASMLNRDLYTLLIDKAKHYGVKLIFLGDELQIPPIGEFKSKIFTDVKNQSKLTTIVRQGENNPNSELLEILRKDVEINMKIYENLFNSCYNNLKWIKDTNKREKKALKDALYINADYSFEGIKYLNESNIKDGKGFECLNNSDFSKRMLEMFLSTEYQYDTNYIKYIAYTNDSVVSWCNALRNKMYGKNSNEQLLLGESLIGYSTVIEDDRTLLFNSEEYIIENITPAKSSYDILGYNVKLKGVEHSTTLFIVDRQDYARFQEVAFNLLDTAYEKRGVAWRHFHNFKKSHFIMDDFKKNGKNYITKDIYYGYGITTHKSQGSTFTNSAINLSNILSRNFNISERARLIYVAMSRSKNINLILNK